MLVMRHLAFTGVCRMTLAQMVGRGARGLLEGAALRRRVARQHLRRLDRAQGDARHVGDRPAQRHAAAGVAALARGAGRLHRPARLLLAADGPGRDGGRARLHLHAAFLSIGYVGPAARLSNQWDTKIGGALADAVSCNPVVKSFGAELREDARLLSVMSKWKRRTYRTWIRGTPTARRGQILALSSCARRSSASRSGCGGPARPRRATSPM